MHNHWVANFDLIIIGVTSLEVEGPGSIIVGMMWDQQ